MEFDGNDVVPSEEHNGRISMKNLRLRDDCQKEEHMIGNHQFSLRGQRSQLVGGESNQAKDVLKQLEVCTAHPEETGSMDKHQGKMMLREGNIERKFLTRRERTWCQESSENIVRKYSEIAVLLYSHQNNVTVKEELAQLSEIFKLIEDINQEMIELDDNSTEELW